MKIKSIMILTLILLTLIGITAIDAETVSFANSTFTIPEGYVINETYSDSVVLSNNTTFIVVYSGEVVSIEKARQNRLELGFRLLDEDNYDADGIEINQQNFHKFNITACIYTFTKNNKNYIITYTIMDNQDIPEKDDNPVTEIFNSLS
ncbi:MAG: hypothetical protein BZ135_01680 [Methanosphaera sp. rholeuAM6]|nr:MAG: hypothetical protein BZ135_01680 [Methanosphaera sp. rholeuAM6]